MQLYAITDRSWLNGRTLYDCVKESLEGGATFLQLREKTLSFDEIVSEAKTLKPLCREYGVPLIINDDPSIAKEVDADGVHIGQSDMEYSQARKILGPEKIIGMTAHNVAEALEAQRLGADYIGVGAVFGSSTKHNTTPLSIEELKNICKAVKIPVVAIGGINSENIPQLFETGINGVAVVSAIFASDNILDSTSKLKALTSPFYDFAVSEIEEVIFSKYKHFVFDLDGTLVDSMPVWFNSGRTFIESCGVKVQEQLNSVLFSMSLSKGCYYIQKEYLPDLSHKEILEGVKGVVVDAYKYSIPLKSGVYEFLVKMKERGITAAIATSNDRELVEIVLNRLGIREFFSEIFTCGDLNVTKDNADIYNIATKFLGGNCDDTLVFEDAFIPVSSAISGNFDVAAIRDQASLADWQKIQRKANWFFTRF